MRWLIFIKHDNRREPSSTITFEGLPPTATTTNASPLHMSNRILEEGKKYSVVNKQKNTVHNPPPAAAAYRCLHNRKHSSPVCLKSLVYKRFHSNQVYRFCRMKCIVYPRGNHLQLICLNHHIPRIVENKQRSSSVDNKLKSDVSGFKGLCLSGWW